MTGRHDRNTGPMLTSPRCGARTRDGDACRAPASSGKSRCRMHGGGRRCGAPKGNQNARRHGGFTREAVAERVKQRLLLDEAQGLLQKLK
ncbi:HGGxSTG domain-containing protein [Bradyrhizobium sp. CB2312]|uniref:HGGxSTG domain-containing protein n=1 Tax=Bradyrhizobium sp. CB2312 TaxID=3039155 RepID=UPI0024B0C180|nr:HGGxSTG domain-containing protein [Bradyrhizobium sp. CB2312]WFU70548.1 HGGxSTG domain-containing protein [Bradyrhizobium sp. CB2312]